jgi:xylan 1,4-beta-xylosidase
VPFHGGFGLQNIHGIAKPAYRAFQLLHGLGTEMIAVEGRHDTVDAWFVRDNRNATLVLTNFALPRHPIEAEEVKFALKGAKVAAQASIKRIDLEHANAKRRWERMGKPEYLNAAMVAELNDASRLREETVLTTFENDTISIEVSMPPQSVAAIQFAL